MSEETLDQLRERVSRMTDAGRLLAAGHELLEMDRTDKRAEYFGDRETAWYYGVRNRMEIILGLEPGALDSGEYKEGA